MLAAASSQWVDWSALWRIILVGLVAGAGLPLVFALGLKALGLRRAGTPATVTAGATATAGAGASADDSAMYAGNPAGLALAVLCFAIFLGGIGYGIYIIVNGS